MKEKCRSIRELLIILSESKELFKDDNCGGLCALICDLEFDYVITKEEAVKLEKYIHTHRPRKGIHREKGRELTAPWYWYEHEWEPRKAWLDSRIALKRP